MNVLESFTLKASFKRDAHYSLLFAVCFHLYSSSSNRSFSVSSSHLSLDLLTVWFSFRHFLCSPCLIHSNHMPKSSQSSFETCYHVSSWLVLVLHLPKNILLSHIFRISVINLIRENLCCFIMHSLIWNQFWIKLSALFSSFHQ
jgi:hypothetical protein